MKIDYNKLIELLLPTFLRRPRIIALLRVLVAKPLQALFVNFHIWRLQSRYEASVSPQVCSLIHAIERTFDCVAEITELDGKPYDFLVSIDRSADLNAIREFIDKHKLAGKSYIFRLGDAAFSVTWLNHIDEHLVEQYSAEWIEYVDASGIDIQVSVAWNNLAYGDFPELTRGWAIDISASELVTSDLEFTALLDVIEGSSHVLITEKIALVEGRNWMMANISEQYKNRMNAQVTIYAASVSPNVDEHNFYRVTF